MLVGAKDHNTPATFRFALTSFMLLNKSVPRRSHGSQRARAVVSLSAVCAVLLMMTGLLWFVFKGTEARESAAERNGPQADTSRTSKIIQMPETNAERKRDGDRSPSGFYPALEEALS